MFGKISVSGLELTAGFENRIKEIPTASYGTDFNVRGMQTRDDRGFVDLKYTRNWEEHGIDLLTRVYYDYDRYVGHYIYAGVPSIDPGEGQRWGAEMQVSKEILEKHRLTAGVDFRSNFKIHQENYVESPFVSTLDDRRHNTVVSPYVNTEWQLLTNLTLHAGARFDYWDTTTHSVNPRTGLVWQPSRTTTLKALYGEAFRAPNAYELYYHDGFVTQKPAGTLKPENVETYELVWEQLLGRGFSLTTSGYFYRLENTIVQVTDPLDGLLVYRNTGRNHGRGVETELSYRAPCGFNSQLSYVFQETENVTTGAALSNSPKHSARWRNTMPFYNEKVFFSTELACTGHTATTPTTAIPGKVGEYWLLNSTLYTRELFKGWSASVSVYNLLDRRYFNAVGDEIAFSRSSRTVAASNSS